MDRQSFEGGLERNERQGNLEYKASNYQSSFCVLQHPPGTSSILQSKPGASTLSVMRESLHKATTSNCLYTALHQGQTMPVHTLEAYIRGIHQRHTLEAYLKWGHNRRAKLNKVSFDTLPSYHFHYNTLLLLVVHQHSPTLSCQPLCCLVPQLQGLFSTARFCTVSTPPCPLALLFFALLGKSP